MYKFWRWMFVKDYGMESRGLFLSETWPEYPYRKDGYIRQYNKKMLIGYMIEYCIAEKKY